ncbi:MAG: peptidylprolyl isomerase [Rhodoferax sp.]|jgi:peptidyl-prolyl cis-trans isomerase SurA
MNFRMWAAPVLGIFCSVMAVGVRAEAPQQADYIVAVVNSEPITNSEVRTAVQRITNEMAQQRQTAPPIAELRSKVLERLINERAQLQVAADAGIHVDEAIVDQSEQAVARQNQIDVAELRARVQKDGITISQFRKQLRDQVILARLHEQQVENRIRVSDADIDRALADQQGGSKDPMAQEVNLANLLISVPEKATSEQTAVLFAQAQKVLARIRAGEDFAALVQEVSAADHTNGGQLGLRRADRYPPAFLAATQNVAVGEVSDIVRSNAGFHILKVIERKAPAAPSMSIVQSHARHILLRTGPELTQAAAIAKLADFKKRIEAKTATFEALAREYSQDGSSTQGGDLGWVGPGTFVPEFEDTMNRLAPGQISQPLVSRFGVHLIELLDRRRVDMKPQEVREAMRNQLRASRYDAAFTTWAQEIRANAFVEFRDPPQ